MRHAFTTMLLSDDEELAVISKLLGHADLSTTADTYGHLTAGMRDGAAARMDRMIGRGRRILIVIQKVVQSEG